MKTLKSNEVWDIEQRLLDEDVSLEEILDDYDGDQAPRNEQEGADRPLVTKRRKRLPKHELPDLKTFLDG